MAPSTPAVTVVMPTLDTAGTLRHALDSLAAQAVQYEAVLVDGGSRDETVAIAASAPVLRMVSAPGTSIYEAINRGIEESHAPAICLLNADDRLLPGALEALLHAFARDPKAGIARGRPRFAELGGGGNLSPLPAADRRADRSLTPELLLRGPCAINSLCIRRSVFDRIGYFDTSFRLASDREWMLRAWRAGVGIAEIPQPVYCYGVHAGSKTLDRQRRNYATIRREHLAIIDRHLSEPGDAELSAALRHWHAAETAMLGAHLFRAGEWKEFTSIIAKAFAVQPLWPLALATDVMAQRAGRESRKS